MLTPTPMLATKKQGAVGLVHRRPANTPFPGLPAAPLLLLFLALSAFNGCSPSGPDALVQGAEQLRKGELKRALELLELSVQKIPTNAQAWNHLGLAYHAAGQPDRAAHAYQEALGRDRNLAVVHFNLGSLQLEQAQPAAAIESFTRYTLLRPEPPEGWLRLGIAQARARQFDAADRTLQYYLKLSPKAPEALNELGWIQAQRKKYREAYNAFHAALQAKPDYAPALLNLAIVAHQHLNYRAFGLQKYKEYLALQPTGPHLPAVRNLVQSLEAELNPTPAPRPATNLTSVLPHPPSNPAATNNSTTLATNLTIPRPATSNTNPASTTSAPIVAPPRPAPGSLPATASTPAPPTLLPASTPRPQTTPTTPSNTPTPPAPLPVKIVTETEDTQSPTQKAPPPATSPAVESPSAPTEKPAPAPIATPAAVHPGPASTPISTPVAQTKTNQSPSLIRRLNPQSWFRSNPADKPDPVKKTPPAPAKTAGAPTSSSQPAIATAEPVRSRPDATPLPATPRFGRYPYQRPQAPSAGDRAKAQRVFNEALQAQEQGQLSAAITAYRSALEADPAFFEAQFNLAVTRLQAGETLAALAAYEAAIAISPKSLPARFNFALALQKANFPEDAATELETTLKDHPDESRVTLTLANLYAKTLGRPDLAAPHYRRTLELQPNHPDAVAIRNWLVSHP